MLILGTDKTDTILEHLPESYLLIEDGPVIDQLTFTKQRRVTYLDLSYHSFNPLKDIDQTQEGWVKANQLIEILTAAFPAGSTTLTKQDATFDLLEALLKNKSRTKYLHNLLPEPDPKDRGAVDAYQTIQTVLLSPVLKRVLDNPSNLRFRGRHTPHNILIARLDRATLGDFDAFILGNLLVAGYPGQVVIPDFGFYAIPSHIQLIRQGRLIAGVNTLSELDRLPILRDQLLLTEQTRPFRHGRFETFTHYGCHTTFRDAETLAEYAHLRPDPTKADNPYNAFIEECMGNAS